MGFLVKTNDLYEMDNTLYSHKNYPVWVKTNKYTPTVINSYEEWARYMMSRDFDDETIFLAGDYGDR